MSIEEPRAAEITPTAAAAVPAGGDEAPKSNLPSWSECQLRVNNSEFIAKQIAEGGYGADEDTPTANAMHRFIYEYDCIDKYKSQWWRHRLELMLNEAAAPMGGVTEAMRIARNFIANMRVPQDVLQAGMQLHSGSQVLDAIDKALSTTPAAQAQDAGAK